jgi:hypothetical protein
MHWALLPARPNGKAGRATKMPKATTAGHKEHKTQNNKPQTI